jgi:hypothetical protein
MLFHVSIEADDPRRVATVLAEIFGGAAAPFPPVAEGSWVALAGDARGTMIEVYPRGTELHIGEGEADAFGIQGPRRLNGGVHVAMATELDIEQVFAIAGREHWPVKYCKRGGKFGVIELWVEGCQMVEVLTPEMQREYLASITIENWNRMLAAGPGAAVLADVA